VGRPDVNVCEKSQQGACGSESGIVQTRGEKSQQTSLKTREGEKWGQVGHKKGRRRAHVNPWKTGLGGWTQKKKLEKIAQTKKAGRVGKRTGNTPLLKVLRRLARRRKKKGDLPQRCVENEGKLEKQPGGGLQQNKGKLRGSHARRQTKVLSGEESQNGNYWGAISNKKSLSALKMTGSGKKKKSV